MDTIAGLIVLVALAYTVWKMFGRDAGTPRDPSGSHPRDPRPGPARRPSEDERLRRREDAADAAFIDGVLFAHYFLDGHDPVLGGDGEDDRELLEDDYDEYDGYDGGWEDDVFHDDAGDW